MLDVIQSSNCEVTVCCPSAFQQIPSSSIVLSHFSPQPFKPKQTFRLDKHVFNKHPVQQEVEKPLKFSEKKKDL